jgi:hypothetical protein
MASAPRSPLSPAARHWYACLSSKRCGHHSSASFRKPRRLISTEYVVALSFSPHLAPRLFSGAFPPRLLHADSRRFRTCPVRTAAVRSVPQSRLRRCWHHRALQSRPNHRVREPPSAAAESGRQARIQTQVSRRSSRAAARSRDRHSARPRGAISRRGVPRRDDCGRMARD